MGGRIVPGKLNRRLKCGLGALPVGRSAKERPYHWGIRWRQLCNDGGLRRGAPAAVPPSFDFSFRLLYAGRHPTEPDMATRTRAPTKDQTPKQDDEKVRFEAWLSDFDARHADLTARLDALCSVWGSIRGALPSARQPDQVQFRFLVASGSLRAASRTSFRMLQARPGPGCCAGRTSVTRTARLTA
jgi:hypothetical protein